MSKQTPISDLGEFGLIDHLTKNFQLQNSSTTKGVGDDAAVVNYANKETVISTDLLLEGIHFDLTYVPLKHLGYKAVVVNISDIYAMNAQPKHITVSIGVSAKMTVEAMEQLYAGIYLACEEYGVDLVGGDTSASMTGLVISITCTGEGEKEKLAYRNGAKNTDLICVSGDLGGAFMGLQLLEREKQVVGNDKNLSPDFSGFEYILQRQLKPEARKDIIKILADENIVPTSMIDISDGLSSELMHIGKQSNAGTRIYEERIPIDFQTAKMAEELNMNLYTVALNGGEDYELLFTVPVTAHDQLLKYQNIKIIGYVTKPGEGHAMITRDGAEIELQAQGWVNFKNDEPDPSLN